jgi:hypothetical protein
MPDTDDTAWTSHGHGTDKRTGPDELEARSSRPAWLTRDPDTLSAKDITAAFRVLLPRPVRLRTDAMVGTFAVTMPGMAASHLHLNTESGREFISGVLSRELGAEVHVHGVRWTKRTVNGQSAIATVRPGPCTGPGCLPGTAP